MHQVYDDETTFKLVVAASNVSGLPMEVCLEEFGRHFLVYCQKNGYDQILRVLGSNLYDFLTNLDNLHDHLASIYPGMRAPSFRVTRNVNTNTVNGADQKDSQEPKASASGSMYLHYYSDRKGLSPIVKGLVMAVAKEFFSTDILVTECKLLKTTGGGEQTPSADDHVVLKIDRRSQANIELDEESSQAVANQAAANMNFNFDGHSVGAMTGGSPSAERIPQTPSRNEGQQKTLLSAAYGDSLSKLASDSLVNSEIMMQTFPFHVIFDRHFNLVQVGSSLLRATSLYWRQRQQANSSTGREGRPPIKFSDLFSIVRPKIEFTFDAIADHTNQVFVVKTRPLVLNADQLRSPGAEGVASARQPKHRQSVQPVGAQQPPPLPARPTCPMDRIAAARRQTLSTSTPPQPPPLPPPVPSPPVPEASHGHGGDADLEQANYVSLRLKGQMIVLSADGSMGDHSKSPAGWPYCLYLCSPRVDHLNQLVECGVNMSDLALHDRGRELMLMSHTHKEDREAVKKLDQATNDLKKMDTKLRLENKRTNEVLHNIFPAKIAALLSHGHQVESESFDLVTCLYSDIIGFTKMCGSENVRPIDIVRLLNTLYLQFDNLTNIHGVFKVETIGDAYVIVGGLPEPVEDHADRCVRMGLDMVKVIATVRSPADGKPIQVSRLASSVCDLIIASCWPSNSNLGDWRRLALLCSLVNGK